MLRKGKISSLNLKAKVNDILSYLAWNVANSNHMCFSTERWKMEGNMRSNTNELELQ